MFSFALNFFFLPFFFFTFVVHYILNILISTFCFCFRYCWLILFFLCIFTSLSQHHWNKFPYLKITRLNSITVIFFLLFTVFFHNLIFILSITFLKSLFFFQSLCPSNSNFSDNVIFFPFLFYSCIIIYAPFHLPCFFKRYSCYFFFHFLYLCITVLQFKYPTYYK